MQQRFPFKLKSEKFCIHGMHFKTTDAPGLPKSCIFSHKLKTVAKRLMFSVCVTAEKKMWQRYVTCQKAHNLQSCNKHKPILLVSEC